MLIGHRKEFIKLTFRALSEGITKNLCSSALDSLYIVERFTYGTNGVGCWFNAARTKRGAQMHYPTLS